MGASANIKPGGTTLPSLRFDSADLPPSIRMDMIREVMSVGYDVGLPDDTDFSIASDAWLLGGMLVNSRTCSPIRFSRTRRRLRRDGLDHYMVMVTRAGAWSADLDGARLDPPGAEVVVFDMAAPLEAGAGSASVTTGCTVPRDTLDRREAFRMARCCAGVPRGCWPTTSRCWSDACRMCRWPRRRSSSAPPPR
jgi:hypothetical protein